MNLENYQTWFKSRYKSTSSFFVGIALFITDFIIIMLSIGLGFFIVNLVDRNLITFRSFINYWVYVPFFFIAFYIAKLYPGIFLAPEDEIRRFSLCTSCCLLGIALSISIETTDKVAISIALILSAPIASIALPVARQIARNVLSKLNFFGVPAVVYNFVDNDNTVINRFINNPELGYKPVLIVSKNKEQNEYKGIPVFTPSEELYKLIKKLNIKVAIIVENAQETPTDKNLYLDILQIHRYTIAIPYNQQIHSISSSSRYFNGIIGYSTTHSLTKNTSLFLKRLTDLLLLTIALIPTLLVTTIIGIAIKISSPGPIFYKHKRIGKNGKEFFVWKFRSMVTNSQEILEKILATDPIRREEWEKDRKFKDDPRITKIGKFIRKTSLDELPQLINILKGEMSFIGPRPVTKDELTKYGNAVNFVLSVKPGLSGMWQISGRSDTVYEERVLLDIYYIQNWSIWLDIWIIIKTIWVVFRKKGAY